MPEKPSIAVLPLKNLPHDPEQQYISDGITEDIITELSRFSELFVIARNSSFRYKENMIDVRRIGRELGVRYVLEGSFRHHDGRVRIVAQLVDALTGAHRWAERYDRELADVFALQDELARAIATTLVAHVNKAEAERALLKPPTSWQAYEYFVRGAHILAGYWSRLKSLICTRAVVCSNDRSRSIPALPAPTRRCRQPGSSRGAIVSTRII